MPYAVLVVVAAILLYAWAESSMGNSDVTRKIAEAIATAEGFFVSGSLPQRANNPGDLKLGNAGLGDINGKTVFASVEEGWAALERQIDLILSGRSAYYSPDWTILQVAQKYTGGDNAEAWANIVAEQLGVTPDTPIGEVS